MKINRIDHISVAVKNLAEAQKKWGPILGKAEPDDSYTDETEKIRVARYWLGEVGFELMESVGEDGEVAKFIEKHGEGIMLISFNVDNTRVTKAELSSQNYPFIDGIRRFRLGEYAFIHPRAVNGVLLELIDGQNQSVPG